MTTASTRPLDQQRAGRLLLAWLRSDKLAIDAVLDETMRDPIGTPGLLFSMTTLATELTVMIAPDDVEEQIERALLSIAKDELEEGDDAD